jgi:hypothetical protein
MYIERQGENEEEYDEALSLSLSLSLSLIHDPPHSSSMRYVENTREVFVCISDEFKLL